MQDLKGRGEQQGAVAKRWALRTSGKTVAGVFDSLEQLWQRFSCSVSTVTGTVAEIS